MNMDPVAYDGINYKGPNKNNLLEYVTPYKICVVIFIQEMGMLKSKNWHSFHIRRILFQENLYRRDFCMLALELIQSPDMDYKELLAFLESGKYKVVPQVIGNFKKELENVLKQDVGYVMDILNKIERIPLEPTTYEPLIKLNSKIGLYLRRVRLFFDKLYFSQTVGLYKVLQSYVSEGVAAQAPADTSMEMEMSSQAEQDSRMWKESSGVGGGLAGLWSRRQAEMFLCQQAREVVEGGGLPAPELQGRIRALLAGSHQQADAHFVSYVNCLRSREFCGAVDSLYHYFDRKQSQTDDENKTKEHRYAALNLAILHANFNHTDEALLSLKEAITLAHEANDNVCLQYAQAWMYKLTQDKKGVLMERSRSKCQDLNLNYLHSFGLQSCAEHAANSGQSPAQVFQMIAKSDVVNSQYSMTDLACYGQAMRCALWAMYGRSEMSSLVAQLLLHSQTPPHPSEPTLLAISNLALYFTTQGEYSVGWAVVNHGKERDPDSKWWIWSECLLYFTESLNRGLWGEARSALQRLQAVDPVEALLRESELCLGMGDRGAGLEAARLALTLAGDSPVFRVRARLAMAKCSPSPSPLPLTDVYSLAQFYHLHYWAGLIALEMANLQLEMGLPGRAVCTTQSHLLPVLSSSSSPQMADALVLLAKTRVAASSSECKEPATREAIAILDRAALLARQIESHAKLKFIIYLQALLAHSIGTVALRNKLAHEFRLLDEEYLTNDTQL